MSRSAVIHKTSADWKVPPNLRDYEQERAGFSWESVRSELDGLPDGGLNIAWEAVGRHARGDRAGRVAIRWLGRDGAQRDFTYKELDRLSNRFANGLRRLGVGKGGRVFLLCGRIPELYVAALGTLKNGSVLSPLFSAFGPEPIKTRLALGDGEVLVTTASLYKRKVAPIRTELPGLKHVLVVAEGGAVPEGTHDFGAMNERIRPEQTNIAGSGFDKARNQFQKGGLARAIGTN